MLKEKNINKLTAVSAVTVAKGIGVSYSKANYICKMIRATYYDFYEEEFNEIKYGKKSICFKHLVEYTSIPVEIIRKNLQFES